VVCCFFVHQELQAVDSNVVLSLNHKRRSSNKLVIVSDDEGDSEHNDKDVCSKNSSFNGDSFSSATQHAGLSVTLASSECQLHCSNCILISVFTQYSVDSDRQKTDKEKLIQCNVDLQLCCNCWLTSCGQFIFVAICSCRPEACEFSEIINSFRSYLYSFV